MVFFGLTRTQILPCFVTPELVEEMKTILTHVANLSDVNIQEMEVMPDHIHVLCSFKSYILLVKYYYLISQP